LLLTAWSQSILIKMTLEVSEVENFIRYLFSKKMRLEVAERKLITALAKGNISLIMRLIIKRPFLANTWVTTTNYQNASLLHWAVRMGSVELTQFLLNKKSDINKLDYSGNTPLENACNYSNITIVKILLSHGANVNLRATKKSSVSYSPDESVGNAPLATAAARGYLDIVRLLIGHGAHICPESNGNTKPHHLTTLNSQYAVNAKIPLLAAIYNGHKDVVEYLIEKDCVTKDETRKINEYSNYFSILTLKAILNKQDSIACFLLHKWAPTIDVLNSYSRPAAFGLYLEPQNQSNLLHYANKYNCKNTAAFLIEKGLREEQ
jgi:ankyrin repeat protein